VYLLFPTSFTAYPARPTLTTVPTFALPHGPAYIHLLRHFTSLHSFRHSSPICPSTDLALNVQRSTRNQHTHTSLTTSILNPSHSSNPSHRHVPDLPLRLLSFMCNTVPCPYPFYLPPLFYPSILSRLFSLIIYYVRIVYVLSPWVLHAYSTWCTYARSTLCIFQPKFISRIPVVYASVSQMDHL